MIERLRHAVLASLVPLLVAVPGLAQSGPSDAGVDSTAVDSVSAADSTTADSTTADSTAAEGTTARPTTAYGTNTRTSEAADQEHSGFHIPIGLSGQASVVGEMYGHSGVQARRPANAWRTSIATQAVLFGEIRVGVDVLVSTAGAQLRQNINQFGLNPRWSWGTLHIGDFSDGYSSLTIQGVRVRGLGVDLRPGVFRFSIQGGRVQRTVTAGADGSVYKRNLIAAKLGFGRESGTFLDLNVVKAKDDVNSLE